MKKYIVRVYLSKFVDIEVEAESEMDAVGKWELPHLDWFDKNDTAVDETYTEVWEANE